MTEPLQRRSQPRNGFSCFARFRMLGEATEGFERLCVTRDFSSHGIYFLALNHQVPLKTRLLLRFPYLADSREVHRECVVEVVRTQLLFPGRCGVGATLISPTNRENLRDAALLPSTNESHHMFVARIDLHA
jgi:hypothetical protein